MRFTCEVIVPSSTNQIGVAHKSLAVLHVTGKFRERVHHPELGEASAATDWFFPRTR